MSLQALLFDLDGTLIDTNLIHARAFEKAFQENGYRVAARPHRHRNRQRRRPARRRDFGRVSANEKDGDAIRDSWEKHYLELAIKSEPLQVFDGALEIIEKAKSARPAKSRSPHRAKAA